MTATPQYAAKTDVPSDRSRAEIERTLERYGAESFAYMTQPGQAQVAFQVGRRQIRFVVPLPEKGAKEFTRTPTGRAASPTAAQSAYEQAVRQRWRALALVVKAKLEAVSSGLAELDQEFYAYVVLPNGRTVYEETAQQVDQMIATRSVGALQLTSGGTR
ncbi:hypothetical protein [Rathayibacter sp. VKM Ac-2630]|uniref:hypothetical protein n=1 Tax=Rathayibacter sp. VKM Ac-2630 TaxID=1938617 RepID=UPI000981F91A|nr:hypothetical protein [Rathayibacter sp. VKM Ac-2630]OOB90727.1 hypothetical protein B0T42_09980 [Rathayibacter sp. VKM Ac-2630]